MQASSQQVVWKKTLHMKVIAATGTEGECYQEDRLAQKKHPDRQDHKQGCIRMIPHKRQVHHRHVGKAHEPQIHALSAYFFKFSADIYRVRHHGDASPCYNLLELLQPVI